MSDELRWPRLDLGRGVRADWIVANGERLGAFLDHEDELGRRCVVTLRFPSNRSIGPKHRHESLDPLSLLDPVECVCGLRGRVVRGEWLPG